MARMRLGQIGGALVIGGCVACLIAMAVIVAGDYVSSDLYSLAVSMIPWAAIPCGLGVTIIGIVGPRPLDNRSIRIGLGMLGIGFLSYMAGNFVPVREGSNNLQSWPHVIGLLGGVLLMAGGVLVTTLALVRSPGHLRVLGVLLVAGLLLLPLAAILSNMAIDGLPFPIGGLLVVLGFAGVFLAVAGIGVIAVAGDRSSAAAKG